MMWPAMMAVPNSDSTRIGETTTEVVAASLLIVLASAPTGTGCG
jgi:hypothetical protein